MSRSTVPTRKQPSVPPLLPRIDAVHVERSAIASGAALTVKVLGTALMPGLVTVRCGSRGFKVSRLGDSVSDDGALKVELKIQRTLEATTALCRLRFSVGESSTMASVVVK